MLFTLGDLSPIELGAAIIAILLCVGVAGRLYWLESANDRLRQQQEFMRQQKAALEDSVREMNAYEAPDGQARSVFGRLNFPTLEPDTLDQGRVDGETTQKTETTIDPQADTATIADENALTPTKKTDSLWTYRVDRQIGRYRLSGPVRVSVRTSELTYDFRIDGRPISLSIYQARRNGQMQSVIDVPNSVAVASLRGHSRPEMEEDFDHWALEVPRLALRPSLDYGLGVGFNVRRREDLPLGAIAYFGVGVVSQPTIENPKMTPTGEFGLRWTF